MTRLNKMWAALIVAVVAWVRSYFGIDLGIDDAVATAIVGGITTFLVWLIPNKEPKPEKPEPMDKVQEHH
ncbi:hypothetical protein DKP76_13430 [Falsochrobactrum shanghaiense]|uniref:Holin n=1 Tax=Falsochrobactrum shanghaiense TaxID=2201899 RepID=A0A316J6V6_9HYPH|nr:hypothetical protein [Falsochrobactrum shanghaiense]PWL17036.1 hypothetical protein DKP76_13430 [Falsochrobactrum shanghaiense]